jgi:hypothetical protein
VSVARGAKEIGVDGSVTEGGPTAHVWGSALLGVRAQPATRVRALVLLVHDVAWKCVPARKQFGVALFDRVYVTKIQLKCFKKFIPKL